MRVYIKAFYEAVRELESSTLVSISKLETKFYHAFSSLHDRKIRWKTYFVEWLDRKLEVIK